MINNKIASLFISMICILSISIIKANNNDLSLLGKVIYIDPGHGGVDPGAIYKDIYESDINLEIAKKVESIFLEKGAIVYMTRDGDYDLSVPNALNRKRSDLSRRANIINNSMCDLYLSIHLNAESTGIWYGAQVFYDDIHDKNEILASIMQEQLKKDLNSKREYKEITDMYLHKRVNRPGILIEVGFLTNANDRYLLMKDSYRQKVALSIVKGVEQYFLKNNTKKT